MRCGKQPFGNKAKESHGPYVRSLSAAPHRPRFAIPDSLLPWRHYTCRARLPSSAATTMSSSTRGGAPRGAARGRGAQRGGPGARGTLSSSNARGGRGFESNGRGRGSQATRGAFGQASQSLSDGAVPAKTAPGPTGPFAGAAPPQRTPVASSLAKARGSWQDRYAAVRRPSPPPLLMTGR